MTDYRTDFPFGSMPSAGFKSVLDILEEHKVRIEALERNLKAAIAAGGPAPGKAGMPSTPVMPQLGADDKAKLKEVYDINFEKSGKKQREAVLQHVAALGRVPSRQMCESMVVNARHGRSYKKLELGAMWSISIPEVDAWRYFLKKLNIFIYQHGTGDTLNPAFTHRPLA